MRQTILGLKNKIKKLYNVKAMLQLSESVKCTMYISFLRTDYST
jgi:hypothetical protein